MYAIACLPEVQDIAILTCTFFTKTHVNVKRNIDASVESLDTIDGALLVFVAFLFLLLGTWNAVDAFLRESEESLESGDQEPAALAPSKYRIKSSN